MKSKKGVTMSMNVIIAAIIALIILVVLVLIFTRTQGGFVEGITNCRDKGGHCVSSCGIGESHFTLGDAWCKKHESGICCISEG